MSGPDVRRLSNAVRFWSLVHDRSIAYSQIRLQNISKTKPNSAHAEKHACMKNQS